MLSDDIRANLAGFERRALDGGVGANDDARSAAVAVCVLDCDTRPRVVIEKRVPRGLNAGQWSLPGGKLEPAEDPVTGALRELAEETGVADVEVAGLLDDFATDSGFRITPVIVLAAVGSATRRAADEIASLHEVPLANLTRDGVPRWRTLPDGRPLLQMPLRHDMVIHAPTGAILLQFREVALLGRHTRVADLAQPEWTRR